MFSLESFADRKFLFATGLSAVAIVLGTELDMLNRFIGTTGLTRRQWGVCLSCRSSIVPPRRRGSGTCAGATRTRRPSRAR